MSTQEPGSRAAAPRSRATGLLIAGIVVTALVTFGITALLMNILQRQQEALEPYQQVVEIDDSTHDPAVWGKNFPQQYEDYTKTTVMEGTKYSGSHPVEQEPSEFDPRTVVAVSRTEEDPRLSKMWDGYAFAVDYRHSRGHAYMLEDQRLTQRVIDERFNQPGACLNCHASLPQVLDNINPDDHEAAWAEMNRTPYLEATQQAEHPITCMDCHDPETMELVVTRPAFIEGMRDLKQHQGIENFDVNRDATADEMRTFVCAQCHVEYYFAGDEKTLVFPWEKGITLWEIMEYYDEDGFVDWTHASTGAPMLKAQHPEYEVWQQGVHASAGVSCADCHMPYKREGAQKVSDHWLRSPMLRVNESCGTCHTDDEETMTERVHTIQDNFVAVRDQTFDGLVALIEDLEMAQTDGTPEDQLDLARDYQRKSSFFLDYVYSENSYGFHAPEYTLTILQDSQNWARMGQLALQGMPKEEIERQFEGTTVPYGGEEPGHSSAVDPGLVDSEAAIARVAEARAAQQ